MEGTPGGTVEVKTLAQVIREDGWEEAYAEGHKQGTQQTQQTLETTHEDNEARRCDAALCAAPGAGPLYTCYGCGTWNHKQCAPLGGDGGKLGVW